MKQEVNGCKNDRMSLGASQPQNDDDYAQIERAHVLIMSPLHRGNGKLAFISYFKLTVSC